MTSMFEPVTHALALSNCPIFIQVGEAMQPGISAKGAWEAVCGREARRGGGLDALAREDRQALDRLFEHLGESGRDAQELLLDAAIQALDYNLESTRSRATEVERIYVSLGLLIGLMLALIVM